MNTYDWTLSQADAKRLLALAITESKPHLPAGFDNRQEWVRHLAPSCGGDEDAAAALVRRIHDPKTPLSLLHRLRSMVQGFQAGAATPQAAAAATLVHHAATAALIAWHGQVPEGTDPAVMLPIFEDLAVFVAGDPMESMFEIAAQRLGGEAAEPGAPGIPG